MNQNKYAQFSITTYKWGANLRAGSGNSRNHLTLPDSTKTLCGKETSGKFGWSRKGGLFLEKYDCKKCAAKARELNQGASS
ncbi:MAG: hypothetical protein WBD21_04750 [Candidatus Acidiferrales bacterium]